MAQKRANEVEDRSIEMIQSEQQRENTGEKMNRASGPLRQPPNV